MRKGWYGESYRHSLARQGIKTTGKSSKVFHGKISGGLSEGKDVSKYPPEQVRKGIRVEMEHTDNPEIAREIAYDHLEEDKRYYDKLELIEPVKTGNPAELKGQQVRIRVRKPKRYARYRTVDVGRKGKLQVVLQDGETQSLRFNLDDYKSQEELVRDLESDSVRRVTTPKARAEAYVLASEYYKKKRGMK